MVKAVLYLMIFAAAYVMPLRAQYYALKVSANNSVKVYPLSDSPSISFTNLETGINIKMFVSLKDKSKIEYKLNNSSRITFDEKAKIPVMKVYYEGNKSTSYMLDSILIIEFNTYMISGARDSSAYSIAPLSVYPNPFAEETTIEFYLDKPQRAEIKIYGSGGLLVKTFKKNEFPEGLTSVAWNGLFEDGSKAPQGLYYCTVETSAGIIAEKLIKLE